MYRGYIKFWRKAQDSSSWNRGLMYQGLIINFLSRAAWKKSSYQGKDILPGQFGAVLNHLAESLDVPRSTFKRMVAHLVADNFIRVQNVGHRFSIITIVNWGTYQDSGDSVWAADRLLMGRQRAADGPPYYKEESKKVRIKAQESYDSSPEFSAGASRKEPSELAVEHVLQKESLPQHSPQDEHQNPPLKAVITLPLNTGKEHPVNQGEIEQWQDLYPAVDVLQALRSMRGWLLANKTRRKTKNGISRFIQHWLAKEQDQSRTRASPFTSGDAHNESAKTVFYAEKGTMSPYGTFWESMLKDGHATPDEVAKKGYDLDEARTIFRAGKGNQGRARLEAANRNPSPDLVGNMR